MSSMHYIVDWRFSWLALLHMRALLTWLLSVSSLARVRSLLRILREKMCRSLLCSLSKQVERARQKFPSIPHYLIGDNCSTGSSTINYVVSIHVFCERKTSFVLHVRRPDRGQESLYQDSVSFLDCYVRIVLSCIVLGF
jgi:hypothetical protein